MPDALRVQLGVHSVIGSVAESASHAAVALGETNAHPTCKGSRETDILTPFELPWSASPRSPCRPNTLADQLRGHFDNQACNSLLCAGCWPVRERYQRRVALDRRPHNPSRRQPTVGKLGLNIRQRQHRRAQTSDDHLLDRWQRIDLRSHGEPLLRGQEQCVIERVAKIVRPTGHDQLHPAKIAQGYITLWALELTDVNDMQVLDHKW